tara:strand:+ start:307 stop:528 length:222 start_codon:yes stop_codon:yes gene_type:complete
MFLVIWTTKAAEINQGGYILDGEEYKDHWIATDTYKEAEETFADLQTVDDVYSISICKPIKSTEPHFVEDLDE